VEAAKTAADSAAIFARHEDVNRTASARLAEVHVLFRLGQFKRAEAVLLELDAALSETPYAETHARVLGNLGHCYGRQGNVAAAVHYYEIANAVLSDLGVETEVLRNRWSVTVILAESGHFAASFDRVLALSADLERVGFTTEAACNGLYVAELMCASGKYDRIEQICRNSIDIFKRAGLGYTSRALTALAYIQEAAQHRTASPKLVRSVREYIRQLPAEPNLLFAPPPP
jgi:tetratricopeptide (TPR) repeat protein